MSTTRRLAAILAADVAGHSRLMGEDEAGTAQALRQHRSAADPLIAQHGGRIVKTTGDGFLIEFGSVVGAVECALALQWLSAERNAGVRGERRMEWRIGVHLGDVLIEGDDILGDGVNIAARLEGIAEPGGICISDDAFRQVRGKVEAEFADHGEQSLKNIARPLRVYRVGPRASGPQAAGTAAVPTSGPALPLPDKPSIAVLPFANISGDPEQEYFADGMVEEIITALSRIRWLFVIARNSTFTYKGKAVDVKQVGRELDLQDKVASSVAGVIEPALQAAEAARSSGRLTTDLTAYDLYLRAFALVGPSNKQAPAALRLLEQAILRAPHYGPALALAAVCCCVLVSDGRSEDPDADTAKGLDFARRALQVAGDDPGVLANVAVSSSYFGEDIGAMTALVDRALALNPSFARAWRISGTLRVWAGQPDIAIEHLETSRRLNPRARVGGLSENIGTRISAVGVSIRHCQCCAWRYMTILPRQSDIASSPPATRRWVGSTRRERRSTGSGS
jgi:adenylate cyclase